MQTAGRRQFSAVLAAALALGLLAAGCGGSSKSNTTATTTTSAGTTTVSSGQALSKAAYVRQMRAIGRSLGVVLNSVVSARNVKEAAAAYTRVQARLRLAQRQLAAITPPAAIAKEHAMLTRALGDFADELGAVVKKIAAGDIAASALVPKLSGYQHLRSAAAAITAAGYNIGT